MTTDGIACHPVAQRITDWLDPRIWITGVTLAVGWEADGIAGIGWALLAVLAALVLPALMVNRGIRRGAYADRHVPDRRQRVPVMLAAIGCVAAALFVLAVAGAPREVIALTFTMLAAVTALTAVTTVWKISIHCAVAAGGVTVLIITFGAVMAAGYLLVALVSWSRVVLRDHTAAHAAAGIAAGIGSALLYLAVRLELPPQRTSSA
jgi:hypothetical protein